MLNKNFFTLLFFSTICSTAWADNLPVQVTQKINENYPGAKVLVKTECPLGVKKTDSYGVLIKNENDSLDAIILYRKNKEWNLLSVPHKLQGNGFFIADFLSDYYDHPKSFDILCTNPRTDKDNMNTDGNAEFTKFATTLPNNVQHLCLSTDVTYNNWYCYTINPATSIPEVSYTQATAD
ncbi:MAG TPA: hypothetical protein VGV92_06710 [Gammaproteobacteria bacterium]|nr:hypothetical protein [Gammaproteobacteria bacterium]